MPCEVYMRADMWCNLLIFELGDSITSGFGWRVSRTEQILATLDGATADDPLAALTGSSISS